MTNDIWHIIIYFFVYSFLGWVWETAYGLVRERRFIYPGFLFGPYCPIYGFGVLLLLVALTPLYETLPLLFAVAFVVMSALEYATSYVLEKLFHQRWWDYSHERFNLHGRIALKSSLFWAMMSVVIVVLIQPQVVSLTNTILASAGQWVPLTVVAIMTIDAVHTIIRMAGLSKLLRHVEEGLDARSVHVRDVVARRVAELRQGGRPRFTERRLLRAFPAVGNVTSLRSELLDLKRSSSKK